MLSIQQTNFFNRICSANRPWYLWTYSTGTYGASDKIILIAKGKNSILNFKCVPEFLHEAPKMVNNRENGVLSLGCFEHFGPMSYGKIYVHSIWSFHHFATLESSRALVNQIADSFNVPRWLVLFDDQYSERLELVLIQSRFRTPHLRGTWMVNLSRLCVILMAWEYDDSKPI